MKLFWDRYRRFVLLTLCAATMAFIHFAEGANPISFFTMALFGLAFIPQSSIVLPLLNVLFLISYPRFFYRTRGPQSGNPILHHVNTLFNHANSVNPLNVALLNCAVVVLFFAFFWLLRKQKTLPAVGYSVLLVLALLWLTGGPFTSPTLLYFATALVCIFGNYLFSPIFFQATNSRLKLRLKDYHWLLPFWQFGFTNWDSRVLREPDLKEPRDREIIRGLAAIALGIISVLTINKVFFEVLQFPQLTRHGFQNPFESGVSRPEAWINVLINCFDFMVIELWSSNNLVILMLWAMGYESSIAFRNPLQARSFADFFSRIYGYYNKNLMAIFFIPIYPRLARYIPHRDLRKYVATGVSIVSFSLLFHLGRDAYVAVGAGGLLSFGDIAFEVLLQSLLMAIAVAVSQIYEAKNWPKPPAILRIPFYFFVFSVIIMFGSSGREPLEIKLKLVAYLFGVY